MAVEVNPQYQTDSILISTDATANADDSKLYAAQSFASALASAESASESEASSVVSLESMNTAISKASIATTKASEANASANNADTYASNALTSANNSASSSSSSSTYATNSYNSSVASASSASSASTSASNASASATTATTKAGEASTSASNALSYKNTTSGYMTTTEGYKNTTSGYMTTTSGYMTTTEGYKNAASTSASNASTSEANALTYKNTATTQAGIATTQASNALTSANNADTSEANALTYSNNALASANAADVSEANALTYAGNALTSANNAASSLSTFNGKYVSSATEPSSPTEGMLWYDTVNNLMKVYGDSGWANAGSSVNGTSSRNTYTATAGQTTFSSTYDAGYVDVYRNGLKLSTSDFTATNGTTVVLNNACSLNDVVDIVAYGTFELADAYTKNDTDVLLNAKVSKVSSTDNAIVRFDGTTGQVQNSGVTIDDSGDLNLYKNAPSTTNIIFENTYAGATTKSRLGAWVDGARLSQNYYYSGSHVKDDLTKGSSNINVATGYITLDTGVAGANPSEKMRIDSSGNVGIGTSPSEKLHVKGKLLIERADNTADKAYITTNLGILDIHSQDGGTSTGAIRFVRG